MAGGFRHLLTRALPYWCDYCPKRFRTEAKFHKHYLFCPERLAYKKKMDEILERNAPVNRAQRRRMAKKAGQIRNWGELNAP